MPTELGPRFRPSFLGVPTHMSTEDYTLWLRWAPRFAPLVLGWYFDVRLGGDRALATAAGTDQAAMWYSLNAKRADVVAELADSVRIIELRTRAQPNAIGRLQTYRLLWFDDPKISKPLELELVTDSTDPDVARMAALVDIIYTVVPPPGIV